MRRLGGVLLGIVLAACGGDGVRPTMDTGQRTGQTTASPAAPTTTTATAPSTRDRDLAIGEEARTANGSTITVYAYEPNVASSRFLQPEAGHTFVAIEVGGCAGPQGAPGGLNPFDFELQMPDNSRLGPEIPVRQPELRSSPLTPGDCIRGWVTFEVPQAQRPAAVVFSASSVIKWRLG